MGKRHGDTRIDNALRPVADRQTKALTETPEGKKNEQPNR
jgi:hypothetical protein